MDVLVLGLVGVFVGEVGEYVGGFGEVYVVVVVGYGVDKCLCYMGFFDVDWVVEDD